MSDSTPVSSAKPKFSMAEVRKTHPKAGLRWTAEEDEELKRAYEEFIQKSGEDFEEFLTILSQQFGRKVGGLRGRLAKYYPNIPGWDYEGMEQRDLARAEAKKKEQAEKREEADALRAERKLQPIPQLDLSDNPEAAEALRVMAETGESLFLTGEAGTGKSTLLQYFRNITEKSVVVLAPTGVAALNVEGQTIHSFCGFGPDITLSKVKKLAPWSAKKKLLDKVHTIVIDEISMVRADLLDCVDKFLRLNGVAPHEPFGGVQMVFIGDLYQLPPVDKNFLDASALVQEYESPYFFDSRAFRSARFRYIQLKTVYRQKDRVFIDVLNAVRNNAVTSKHLEILNSRATNESNAFHFEQFAIYLTPTNARAKQVNDFFLQKIESPASIYQGVVRGSFENRELPTDEQLRVKVGAQVMMLNNDQKKRWVNGTMGKIVEIVKAEDSKRLNEDGVEEGLLYDQVAVELETGEVVYVIPHTWEMFQFVLDKYTNEVDSKTTGTYTQYPFKLAWAVTIHKAQGKTFDKVYVDLASGTFAHGQLYVALSRCRTLEGIFLKRAVIPQDILLDQRIVNFLSGFSSEKSTDPLFFLNK